MGNSQQMRRLAWWLCMIAGILVLVLTQWPDLVDAAPSSPGGEVRAAWRRAQEIGQYHFTSELLQTTHPGPALVNVGRGSETQALYMEGEANLPTEQLEMALWENQGTTLDPNDAIEIHIKDKKAQGRVAGGAWQELPEFSDAFAPGRDLMGYLAGIRNVRAEGVETRMMSDAHGAEVPVHYHRYTFEVDGPDFAAYMRDQLEQHLAEHGELPPGMSLSLSDTYLDLTGDGEVWLSSDGTPDGKAVPRRIQLHLVYPEMRNGDWIEATVTNDFYGYPTAAASPLAKLSTTLRVPNSPAEWQAWLTQANLLAGTLGLLMLLVTVKRSRVLYAGFAIAMIITMVLTPLLQSQHVYAFNTKQMAEQAEYDAAQEQAEKEREYEAELYSPDWNPHTAPLVAAEKAVALDLDTHSATDTARPLYPILLNAATSEDCDPNSENDSDGDGLSDKVEAGLGTKCTDPDTDGDGLNDGVEVNALGLNPQDQDSDGDGLYDNVEVQGFDYNGQKWYSDPLNTDTDNDEQVDGLECPERLNQAQPTQACRDTDGDGTPDIFDSDNDGDGVPDRLDISPQTQQGAFDFNNPFTFKIDSNEVNKPIVVDIQLRPTNPDHLTYARNVLDWPSGDEAGQMQRQKDNYNTFATQLTSEQRSADPSAANGDMRLIPMLEVQMSGIPLPLPMTAPSATLQLEDNVPGNLILQHYSDTQVKFTFTDAGAIYDFKVYEGACNQVDRKEVKQVASVQGGYILAGARLTDFADGSRSLEVTQGSNTTCVNVPDIPNGAYTDQMVDEAALDQYNMMVQDMNDDGRVAVYAPLNVVPDETGGGRVAFAARLLYQQSHADWGNQHQARVAWLVQVLTDACKPVPENLKGTAQAKDWCDHKKNWVLDQTQVIHTYYDDWTLTGLTVREDYGLDVALISSTPATGGTSLLDKQLWKLANGLEAAFITGRSQDGQTRDITIAEIVERFSYGSSASDVARWGLPNTAFHVQQHSFANLDEIAHLATTYNQAILDTFAHDRKPTLLTARESRSRNANIDDQWNAASATLEVAGDVQTVAAFQWTPYHYTGGAWQPYAMDVYLDQLGAALKPFLETQGPDYYDPADPEVLRGAIISAQLYGMVLVNGVSALIPPELKAENPNSPVMDSSLFGASMDRTITKSAGDVARSFTEFILEDSLGRSLQRELFLGTGWAKEMTRAYRFKLLAKSFYWEARNVVKSAIKSFVNFIKKSPGKAIGLAVAAALVLIAVGTAAAFYIGLSPDKVNAAIKFVTAAMKVVSALNFIYTAYKKIKQVTSAVTNSVKAAPIAGIILAGVVAIGFFAAQIAILAIAGQLTFTNVASAVADMVAGLTMSILMILISLTGVGAIALAIIGAIDALIGAICAALPAEWTEAAQDAVDTYAGGLVDICGGITGTLTKWIKGRLYSNVKVVTFDSATRIAFTAFRPRPADTIKGFTPGNNLELDLALKNRLYLTSFSERLANSDMTALYFWQYNLAVLRRSSFKYVLAPTKRDVHQDLAFNAHYADWYYEPTGSHAIGADWFNYAPGAWAINRDVSMNSPILEVGFNRGFDAYLMEGYAIPLQECVGIPTALGFVPVCWIRPEWGTRPIPLSESLIFDIFPATLSEFYQLSPKGDGYALGWGNHANLAFPRLRDADGDGLTYESDPNDSHWDTDGDGLNDYFETQQGLLPTSSDADGDGLDDRLELIYESDPFLRDSDGDGLTDQEELDGWEFVYDFNDGKPKTTWVTSDPTQYDTDDDGIRDDREKVFGFNPRVWSDPKVLDFKTEVEEHTAPLILLRFEESGTEVSFADAAGYGHTATCAGDSCPTLQRIGYHGYARDFDGVDDGLDIPAEALNALDAGTIAAWVYLDDTTEEPLVSKQHDGVDTYGVLSLGRLNGQAGRVYFHARNGGPLLQSNTNLSAGQWYHIAVTFDTQGAACYINGTLDAEAAGDFHIPDDLDALARVGAWVPPDYGRYFDGRIDEFAIFDYALSASEIQTVAAGIYTYQDDFVQPGATLDYDGRVTNELNGRYAEGLLSGDFPSAIQNPPAPRNFTLQPRASVSLAGNLQVRAEAASQRLSLTQVAGARITNPAEESGNAKLQLHFEEARGATSFKDTSGFPEYPGACSGVSCPTAGGMARIGRGLTFDGSDDYVQVPYAAALNPESFTVAVWAKVTGGSGYRSVVTSREGAPQRGYILYATPDNQWEFWVGTGAEWIAVNGGAITQNAWIHLAGVYNASMQTLSFYADGELIDSKTGVVFAPNVQHPLRIGAGVTESAAELHFTGAVDEVHIYDKALSAADVQALFQSPVLLWRTAGNEGDVWYDFDTSPFQRRMHCPYSCPDLSGNVSDVGGYLWVENTSRPASLNLEDGNFTLAAWIKPESSSDYRRNGSNQAIIGLDTPEADYPTLIRRGNDLIFSMKIEDSAHTRTFQNVLTPYQWNHVVATMQPNAQTGKYVLVLYVNGLPRGTQTFDTIPTLANYLSIRRVSTYRTYDFDWLYIEEQTDHGYGEQDRYGILAYHAGQDRWIDLKTIEVAHTKHPNAYYYFNMAPVIAAPHHYTRFILYEADQPDDDNDHLVDRSMLDEKLAKPPYTYHQTFYEWVYHDWKGWDGATGKMKVAVSQNTLPFVGAINEVGIYKRAFTSAEVDALYRERVAVMEIPFDDAPGRTRFHDLTGNAGAICNGNTCPVSGVRGRVNSAARFDGANDVVKLGSDQRFVLPNTLTFAAWLYPTSNSTGMLINKEGEYEVARFDDGTIRWAFANTTPGWSWVNTNYVAPLNQWTHIAVVYNEGVVTTYANGTAVHTYTGSGTIGDIDTDRNAVWVGGRANGSEYFTGMLDEIGLYKFAFSADQISALYQNAPQFNLTFDEQEGAATFTDIAGGQTGTNSGAQAGVKGQVGLAASFDGLNDAVNLPASAFNNLSAGTIATWVYLQSNEEETLFAKYKGTSNYGTLSVGYAPGLSDADAIDGRVYFRSPSGQLLASDTNLETEQWHHIAVTFNTTGACMHINGQRQSCVGGNHSIPDDMYPTATALGAHAGNGGRYLNGRLDEFAIYHRVLSELEIARLYAAHNAWVEERQSVEITVDADAPTAELVSATAYRANRDAVLHINAQDSAAVDSVPASGVDRVIWRVTGGTWREAPACRDAEPGTAWCPTFDPTTLRGEGSYTIETYAIDRVGNRSTVSSYPLYVDGAPPNVSTDIAAGVLLSLTPHPTEAQAQAVTLSGTVSDPSLSPGSSDIAGSGVEAVYISLLDTEGSPTGEPILATVQGNAWNAVYPLSNPEPTGDYTLRVVATDVVGNSITRDLVTFHIDASAPSALLNTTHLPTSTLSSGTLYGVVSEAPVIEGAALHLMFEEPAGASAFADSSGQVNHATCAGTCPTAGQTGQYGSALTFNGVDDYVDVPYTTTLNAESFTVATWAKVTGGDGYRSVVTSREALPRGYILYATPQNTWEFWVGTEAEGWLSLGDVPIAPNVWTHLAGVYSKATQTMHFYVDGKLISSRAVAAFAPNTGRPLRVGAGATEVPAQFYFTGDIDDVRVFNRVLIAEEVARLAQRPVGGVDSVAIAYTPTSPGSPFYNEPAPAGQVLHLPLDDQPNKSGNIAFRDVAALAKSSTRSGTCSDAACPTTSVTGRRGTAAYFDGVDDHIDVAYTADVNPGSFTVAAWAKVTGGSGYRTVLASREGAPQRGYTLYATPHNTWEFWAGTGTSWAIAGAAPMSLDIWTHLTGVYDADTQTLRFYADGKLVASQTGITFEGNTQYPLRIGAGASERTPDYYFTGVIDEVRILNRALASDEVAALWRGTDPLLHLTFDDQRVIDTPLRDRSAWGHDGLLHVAGNIARGKAATQSSTYLGQYDAARAVDGNTNGDFTNGSVTHTNHEYRPWWQVDLGASYEIASLNLWNRTDGSSERLNNFYVFVSDMPFISTNLEIVRAQPNVWSYYHAGPAGPSAEIAVGRTGRYVRVQLSNTNYLSLAEVQIWDNEATQPLRTVMGRVGNGTLALDGKNDYVELPAAVFNDLAEGTLAIWIYLDDNTEETIFAKRHDGVNAYGVLSVGYTPSQTGEAGRVYFHTKNGDLLVQSNTLLPTEQWIHLAATFNTTGACLYVNGVQDACAAGDHTIPDDLNVTAITLGAHLGTAGGRYLDGMLDDFTIYPRVLSPTEVAALAQQGWQAATVTQSGAGITFSEWSMALPAGLEGSYQIDARGSDALGLTDARVESLGQWQGSIDTLAPRIDVNAVLIGSGPTAYTNVYITAQDFNLTTDGYIGPCPVANDARVQRETYTSPWYLALAPEGEQRLYALSTSCQPAGDQRATPVTFCDTAGNCATATASTRAPQQAASLPLLDALVLTPTHGSVLTTLDPVALTGATYAQDGLDTLTVTVDGGPIYTQTWPAGVITDTWMTTWTPGGEGAYRIEALLQAPNGVVLTDTHPITVIVDTQAPEIAIASTVLTSTHYQPSGVLALYGPITDTGGIASVEWRLGSGDWQPAQINGTGWQGLWRVGFDDLPDGETFTVAARATDVAGRTAETTANVAVDLVGPEAVTLTQTSDAASITLDWTESSDPSGLLPYELRWTTRLTETEHTLVTTHPTGSGGSVTRPAIEGSKVSFRLGSRDGYGNVTWQTLGPVYVETAFTPDYVTPDEDGWYRAWMASDCSQLGTDARIRDRATGGAAVNTAQDFYGTWNSDGLRLTWEGANWRTEGDLFVYLDTQPGGSTRVYNPYVETISNTTILLPNLTPVTQTRAAQPTRAALRATGTEGNAMGADYLVWMQDTEIATLMSWNAISATWQTVTETWAYTFEQADDTNVTDFYLPFTALGISNPAETSLSLVAFATEEHALRLWATMPPRNPVNSAKLLDAIPQGDVQRFALLRAYTWPSLGSGVCPNGAQTSLLNRYIYGLHEIARTAQQPARLFTGADVHWNLAAEPAGIAYSVLEDNLFNIMDDVFEDMTDWDAVDAELCALNPDDPECERADGDKPAGALRAAQSPTSQPRLLGTASNPHAAFSISEVIHSRQAAQSDGGGLDFNAQDGLAAMEDVSHPAVGHGQTVTYTIRYINRGTFTSTGLTADIVTWGPVRLLESEGAEYATDPDYGEWYSLILPLGNLLPGEVLTATFTGIIDLDFDPDNNFGWATLDVILYDDTGSWDENQLDWFYVDHEVDDEAPSISMHALPGLIGPGMNTLRGTASDQSAVPTVTLALVDPTYTETWQDCEDATPDDGAWTCEWDAGAAAEGDIFYLSARGTDVFDQVGTWAPSGDGWYTFTVDATPPTLTLNLATTEALADGVIGPDETLFGGRLSDNRLVEAVEICEGVDCTTVAVLAGTDAVSSTTYIYEDVPVEPMAINASTACEGGKLLVRPFNVTEDFTVGDVAVGLNLTHTYRYDLEAWLVAPSGTWANILWNGTDADNYDVLLRDTSTALLRQDKQDHDTGAPYFDYERRPDDPLSIFYGEPAQGEWQLQICDFFPDEDDGAYHRSRLELTAYELPASTQGDWIYDLPAPQAADMASRTLSFTGIDSVGNRSAPYTLTFAVDTSAPVLTVTQTLSEVVQPAMSMVALSQVLSDAVALTAPTVATGQVTDGNDIAALYAVGETEDGYEFVTPLVVDEDGTWRFELPATAPGVLTYWLHAEDSAGNERVVGPFRVLAIAPPTMLKSVTPDEVRPGGIVTYTLTLENSNPDRAVTGLVITDALPVEVTPLAPLGTAYLPPAGNTLVWEDLTIAANSSYTLAFAAIVSDDVNLIGTHVVNTATYTSDLGGGVTPEATFIVASLPPITFIHPEAGQIFTATDNLSVTIPITVSTRSATLPEDGYWELWRDGTRVISQVLTYTTSINLEVGTHTLSATLYTPEAVWVGSDEVVVNIVPAQPGYEVYLPLVLRTTSAP